MVLFLLALIIIAVAAAVVASATTGTSQLASGPRRATAQASAPSVDVGLRRSAAALAAQSNRAIDHILAYTPFVKAGIPRRRVIALSFDDGPSPYTPLITRELVELHVPATFFVVGQQLDYFSAGLRDELRHGFVVGDHTENHRPLTAITPVLQYRQIYTDALRIRQLGGGFPRLFRPPYGLWNGHTLTILHRLHMLMVMWSDDPADWSRPGTQVIIERVIARAHPGEIIELHDGGGDRSQTAAALPRIIGALRRRHYQFVTVPQLLSVDPPPHHQQLSHPTE